MCNPYICDMSQRHSVDGAAVLVERTAGLTAVAGVFLMLSSVLFTITGTMGIHNAVLGAVIAVLASVHAYRTGEQYSPSIVLPAVLALLGLWTAAAPFVFGISQDLVLGSNLVIGILIVLLSGAGVYGGLRTSNTRVSSA